MVNKITIGDALKKGIALLKQSDIPGAATDAAVLLGHVLGCERLYLTVHRDDALDNDKKEKFFDLVARRCKKEPVAYIVGKKEFMSMDFCVNSSVLVPRPDTEILVEFVIDALKDVPNPQITDMCTGSGAIAVSLAKYIDGSRVRALDISDDALKVASLNAQKNGASVEFELFDVLKPYNTLADAVVSNPPYIRTGDIEDLDDDVSAFEPHLALDGGGDGLIFYRTIVANIRTALKCGGLLAFEVGMGQADDVLEIMSADFEHLGTIKDLAGIERVVYGYLRQLQSFCQQGQNIGIN